MTPFRRLAASAFVAVAAAGTVALVAPAAQAADWNGCGQLQREYSSAQVKAKSFNDEANWYHTRAQATRGSEHAQFVRDENIARGKARFWVAERQDYYRQLDARGCLA